MLTSLLTPFFWKDSSTCVGSNYPVQKLSRFAKAFSIDLNMKAHTCSVECSRNYQEHIILRASIFSFIGSVYSWSDVTWSVWGWFRNIVWHLFFHLRYRLIPVYWGALVVTQSVVYHFTGQVFLHQISVCLEWCYLICTWLIPNIVWWKISRKNNIVELKDQYIPLTTTVTWSDALSHVGWVYVPRSQAYTRRLCDCEIWEYPLDVIQSVRSHYYGNNYTPRKPLKPQSLLSFIFRSK